MNRLQKAARAAMEYVRPQPAPVVAPQIESLENRRLLSADWSGVEVSGGGYLSGIHIHVDGTRYVRTDVGGLYRIDESAQKFIPLTDWIPPERDNLYGVAGLALHPTNSNIIIGAFGASKFGESALLISYNKGQDWQEASLDVTFDGNGPGNDGFGRFGQRLEFNPADPDELLVGSRGDGLWRYRISTDSATRVNSIPFSGNFDSERVQAVVFDPTNAQNVYVAIRATGGNGTDGGVYRSTTGAAGTFSFIANSPGDIADMEISGDGDHLILARDGGLSRLDNPEFGNGWYGLNVSNNSRDFITVDFSPHDDDTLITAPAYFKSGSLIYLSDDAGSTWTDPNETLTQNIPWMPDDWPGSAIADFEWDPFNANRVIFTDWYAMYETSNINGSTINWSNPVFEGHRELVTLSLAVPPNSDLPLISGSADVGAMRHTSLTSNPTETSTENGPTLLYDITGIGVSRNSPDRPYILGTDKPGSNAEGGKLARYDPGSDQWVQTGGWNANWGHGRVMVNPNDANNLVAASSFGGVRVSYDGGVTFSPANGTPSSSDYRLNGFVFIFGQPLAVDGVNGSTFYLYEHADGTFHRSTDGGANWSQVASGLPSPISWQFNLVAEPTRAGRLWLGLNQDGLRRSDDGGSNWQNVGNVERADLVAIGAAKPGTSTPTIYLYGKAGGASTLGYFMSTDNGANWERIGTSEAGIARAPTTLAADPDTYGLVYAGTNGRGIAVGKIDGANAGGGGNNGGGNNGGGNNNNPAGNLVADPSFDTGFFTWQEWGNAEVRSNVLEVDPWTAGGAGQNLLNVTAGVDYTLAADLAGGGNGSGRTLTAEFLDANWSVIGSIQLAAPAGGFQRVSATGTAPAATAHIRVGAWSNPENGTFRVDNVSLSVSNTNAGPTLISGWQNPNFDNGLDGWWAYDGGTYFGNGVAGVSTGVSGGFGQSVPITPGTNLQLRAVGRSTGGNAWRGFGIQFFDANWNQLSLSAGGLFTDDDSPQFIDITAPAGAAWVQVWAYSAAGSGRMEVEELSLFVV